MLGGNGQPTAAGNTPQSLETLLERQWEQGSQFLMEQAQHFDSNFWSFFGFVTFGFSISPFRLCSCVAVVLFASIEIGKC